MKIWKQVVLSLAILLVAFVAWLALFPGAGGTVQKSFLGGPVAAIEARLGLAGDPPAGGQAGGGQAGTQGGGQAGAQSGAQAGGKSAPSPGAAQGGGQTGAQGGGQAGGQGGAARAGGFARGPTLVVVRPATSAVLNDRVTALGTGVALQSALLAPQASGTLTQLSIGSGAAVTSGAVVAALDSDTQQIAYDKARLALDDAQTTLAHDQQMVKSGTMPASQLQAVQLAANVADLTMRSARHDLDARQVVAPFSGVVGLVTINPGIAVTPQTVIATLEDTSSLVVRFTLSERLIGTVKAGDAAQLVPVARPDRTLQAQVTAVDSQIDSASGTFQVEALLPNPDGALVSGMTFAVSLKFPGDTYVAVDPLAIQWGSQGAFVWRLTADSKVEKVSVQIVQRNTDAVLVAGDIHDGDPIVTEGLDGLRPGTQVQEAGKGGGGQGSGQGQGQGSGQGQGQSSGQGSGQGSGQAAATGGGGQGSAKGTPQPQAGGAAAAGN